MTMSNGVYYVTCVTGALDGHELGKQQMVVYTALVDAASKFPPYQSFVLPSGTAYSSDAAQGSRAMYKQLENSVLRSIGGLVVGQRFNNDGNLEYPHAIVLASRSLDDLKIAFGISKKCLGEAAFLPVDASPEFLQKASIELRPL